MLKKCSLRNKLELNFCAILCNFEDDHGGTWRETEVHRSKFKLAGINLRIWKRVLCLIQVSINFPPTLAWRS